MKPIRLLSTCILLIPIGFFILASPALGAEVTLVGEINDTQQLVADNQIYEVGPGEMGDQLVTKMISQRVKVVGKLVEENGIKTIIVKSFEAMEE